MNLAQILQQYYYQTDFVNYVAQFSFPVDYIGPEYHAFFRDKDLISNAHAHGFKVAPWPVGWAGGTEHKRGLTALFFWSIIVLYQTVLCETVRPPNIHSSAI